MNYKSKKKLYANEYINRKNYERYEKKILPSTFQAFAA
jgi:hypothetical protein